MPRSSQWPSIVIDPCRVLLHDLGVGVAAPAARPASSSELSSAKNTGWNGEFLLMSSRSLPASESSEIVGSGGIGVVSGTGSGGAGGRVARRATRAAAVAAAGRPAASSCARAGQDGQRSRVHEEHACYLSISASSLPLAAPAAVVARRFIATSWDTGCCPSRVICRRSVAVAGDREDLLPCRRAST